MCVYEHTLDGQRKSGHSCQECRRYGNRAAHCDVCTTLESDDVSHNDDEEKPHERRNKPASATSHAYAVSTDVVVVVAQAHLPTVGPRATPTVNHNRPEAINQLELVISIVSGGGGHLDHNGGSSSDSCNIIQ